jgi:N-acetylmuramoyl-L-alanine amidase
MINYYITHHTKHEILSIPANQIPIEPAGILVHSTGAANPNLRRYVDAPDLLGENKYGNHWNQPGIKKSPHIFVGLDKAGHMAACEVLPLNIACWGCGAGKKGSYNYPPTAYIQIEFCESDMTDSQYFHTGYAYLVELVADLCRKYGFSVDKITSHKEAAAAGYASNHGDPESYFFGFGENMDKFRSRVAAKLAEKTDIIYRVQVGAFRSKENAQKMTDELSAIGYPVIIKEGKINEL